MSTSPAITAIHHRTPTIDVTPRRFEYFSLSKSFYQKLVSCDCCECGALAAKVFCLALPIIFSLELIWAPVIWLANQLCLNHDPVPRVHSKPTPLPNPPTSPAKPPEPQGQQQQPSAVDPTTEQQRPPAPVNPAPPPPLPANPAPQPPPAPVPAAAAQGAVAGMEIEEKSYYQTVKDWLWPTAAPAPVVPAPIPAVPVPAQEAQAVPQAIPQVIPGIEEDDLTFQIKDYVKTSRIGAFFRWNR